MDVSCTIIEPLAHGYKRNAGGVACDIMKRRVTPLTRGRVHTVTARENLGAYVALPRDRRRSDAARPRESRPYRILLAAHEGPWPQ